MSDSVLTKTKNYRLWQGGEYGNKLRAWRSVAEWRDSGFAGKVVLRTVGVGEGPCAYNLDQGGVDQIKLLYMRGIVLSKIRLST